MQFLRVAGGILEQLIERTLCDEIQLSRLEGGEGGREEGGGRDGEREGGEREGGRERGKERGGGGRRSDKGKHIYLVVIIFTHKR